MDVYEELPKPEMLTSQFKFVLKYWQNRNLFIADMRRCLGGLNEIAIPETTLYMAKTLHTYIMAALINEKMSRYLYRPTLQVIPDNPLDDASRAKSTRVEDGINVGGYEIERRGGGDIYNRVMRDALLLGMGVQRIIRGEPAYWSDLVEHDGAWIRHNLDPKNNPKPSKRYSDEERKEYKQNQGIPITKDYVPLEFFYPHYDGKNLAFSFELEETTKYSVLNNPMYQNERGSEVLKNLNVGADGGLDETVTIVQWANNEYHGYYLAGPGANSNKNKYPRITPNTSMYRGGELQCLYAYEHGIGRSIYNTYNGRFGAWSTDNNEVERVGKALMELSQAADEILSQVFTNVRATYWPSLNYKMDPEARGFGVGMSRPEPPKIKEGQSIVSYINESIVPIFSPVDDPKVFWIFDTIQQQIGRLGGGATLFGERAPGVDTGYNQAIQQTQQESLDNKQEQNLQAGAEEEALIVALHVKKIGEPVDMVYVDTDKKTKKKGVKYATLDPADLTPMPRFSAQVRKQGPTDLIAALRAFAMATDDRGGKGPAMSDETAREELLAMGAPDVEYDKILIESQKRELIANGFITDKIGDQANVKLAKHGTPQVSPEMLAKADPALLAAIQQIQPAAAEQGGTDPKLLADVAGQAGLPPGPIPGDAMLGNRVGEAIEGNIQTGTGSI